ncbi:thiazole synthase [Aureibacillus halotolerans]|uniref:Thiazole synthase n=1 Tax=Aureibacillus halotolerans TaxID=1508390 RepID=A0A4R6U7D9_9BACI|nr:thiazole synthase [Aureibacillus halotolerans]TDQ41686.1 thiazole-phosphate synthase [Aureibacillus halotolerans]
MKHDSWKIGEHTLTSRIFLGTGRFPNPFIQNEVIAASGSEVLTFAVRRVNTEAPEEDAILQHLGDRTLHYLPNTSGATNANEAIRIARLARASGLSNWIKVEISVQDETLLPDPIETLKATEQLASEGFTVFPYTSDDPVLAKRLEEAGAAAVMPGGSPIGTGLGILNPYNIERICTSLTVPVIVDAGIGTASDATKAMELGAQAVLINTAIAKAKDPVRMATAMRYAVEAGLLAKKAGRIQERMYATESSPTLGKVH